MLIRSKSEVSLVNIETGLLTIQDGDTIVFHSNNWKDVILGRYSTMEKTLKVMDMIQEAYDICERCKLRLYMQKRYFVRDEMRWI